MTVQVVWSSGVDFLPETRSPAQARDFVTRRLAEHELAYLIEDVRLVVSELVSNAVAHAQTPIRVSVAELLFCLRLTVSDDSADLRFIPPARQVDGDAEGGRGLWVTEACSYDWGTDLGSAGGKAVWALFPVRPKSSWVEAGSSTVTVPVQSPRRPLSSHNGVPRLPTSVSG